FARRQPLKPQRTNINELAARITHLLQRMLGEDIEITLSLQPDLWPVVVDPAQLEASLANLATNARDAMPAGGRLSITTDNRQLDEDYAAQHLELAAGDYALIEVSDTGSGMPPEVANRIFEPFFTTKAQGKGTGLGLAMVFGFMKQSGGHINVYSEMGIGTTIRLYLPRAAEISERDTAAPAGAVVRGSGQTILVVEDNPALRRVATRQLTDLGYRVIEAENGQIALELLERELVDALLTDVVMPGGTSGYDLAAITQSRWPEVKIVLVSGFPGGNTNHREQPAGVRLVVKPYRRDELAGAIADALAS
ncbi:MAG: ATP-binding protein, partial [Bradyrhizobium sp.]